jgi:hypothetical protein
MKSKQIKANLKSRKFRPNLYGEKYKTCCILRTLPFWFGFFKIFFFSNAKTPIGVYFSIFYFAGIFNMGFLFLRLSLLICSMKLKFDLIFQNLLMRVEITLERADITLVRV